MSQVPYRLRYAARLDFNIIGLLKLKLLSGKHEHFGRTDGQTDVQHENSIPPHTHAQTQFAAGGGGEV